MPPRLRLSWDMKTWKLFLLSVLESLEFGWQVIRYASSLSRPSSGNEPHWDVRCLPCEVSSPFTKKASARRDSPALGFTRRFASCGCCCPGYGPDGSLRPS